MRGISSPLPRFPSPLPLPLQVTQCAASLQEVAVQVARCRTRPDPPRLTMPGRAGPPRRARHHVTMAAAHVASRHACYPQHVRQEHRGHQRMDKRAWDETCSPIQGRPRPAVLPCCLNAEYVTCGGHVPHSHVGDMFPIQHRGHQRIDLTLSSVYTFPWFQHFAALVPVD